MNRERGLETYTNLVFLDLLSQNDRFCVKGALKL